MPKHYDGLFPRQPSRAPDRAPRQLHLGGIGLEVRRPGRCPLCAQAMSPHGRAACGGCGAYTCTTCDQLTSGNGGDGEQCYSCIWLGAHTDTG